MVSRDLSRLSVTDYWGRESWTRVDSTPTGIESEVQLCTIICSPDYFDPWITVQITYPNVTHLSSPGALFV
jgi:hypothetical protein